MILFEKPGKRNTEETIKIALAAAKERGIGRVVVASNTGASAQLLLGQGVQVVCVTHADGYAEKGTNELAPETRAQLEAAGAKLVTAAHVLSGAERGLSSKFQGAYPVEIMAHTLRMFGQGTKVCVEVAVMAADAGAVPYGEKVLALGGSGRGLDTAAVITPAYASCILETKIHEIVCKPGL